MVGAVLFLHGTTTSSHANDREAPPAVLDDRSYFGAMFETGYLTAVRTPDDGSDVTKYDLDGSVIWKVTVKDRELISADEWGSSTYQILFDRLSKSSRRYFDGVYTLEICAVDGACRTARTFSAGARDIALSAEGVWVLEHTLSEIDYTWPSLPIPPPLSQASLYSFDGGDLIKSHQENDAVAIDHDGANLYVELFGEEKVGIFKVPSSDDERVGGLRPYTIFGDLHHSLCDDFIYVESLELTYCLRAYNHVGEGRTYYDVWLIDRDSGMLRLDAVRFNPSHGAGIDKIKEAGAGMLRRQD